MIRSAAKNLGWVCVIVDPNDYTDLVDCIDNNSEVSYDFRLAMACKAFATTSQYETMINNYLNTETFPDQMDLTYKKYSDLRYGENPQQKASVYKNEQVSTGILNSSIHQGKELSYNNIMDTDAAVSCVVEFDKPACTIIKHANPCGVAISENINDAFNKALAADRLSSFGGVIALNRECTEEIALELSDFFIEIIIAPSFSSKALDLFSNKKNLRVIEINNLKQFKENITLRNIHAVSYTHVTLRTKA